MCPLIEGGYDASDPVVQDLYSYEEARAATYDDSYYSGGGARRLESTPAMPRKKRRRLDHVTQTLGQHTENLDSLTLYVSFTIADVTI